MTIARRSFLALSTVGAASIAAAPGARSQPASGFPDRPVRLVVPFPPGGPTDLIGRMVGQRLSAVWNQTVVVENRAGASGSIGSNFVARSAPDGYTLVFSNNATHGAYEQLNPRQTPYQTLRDFTPVALIGIAPLVLIARSTLDVKDARELITYARANPGKLNYASPAYGSSPHLATELLKLATGTDIVHVPFTGAAPAMNALISGNVDIYIGGVSTVRPHVREGRARALAAVYGQRVQSWPDLPTMAEQGISGVEYDSWYGLLGPASMAAPIVQSINDAVRRAMTSEEARRTLENFGIEAKLGTPAEHAEAIREEMARTARVIREANIRVE